MGKDGKNRNSYDENNNEASFCAPLPISEGESEKKYEFSK